LVLEPTKRGDDDPRFRMAKMVKLLTRVGPDIDYIARQSGTYKETLRYWYKEKIVGAGMAVQAVPNEAALGLKRVAAKVRVNEMFLPHIQPVFWAMNDLSYLAAFEQAIPDDFYMLHATVPEKFTDDYKSYILKLKDMGIFESAEFYEFDWFRREPMRADYYDFGQARWDYDWGSPITAEHGEISPAPARKAKFDKVDLLILKELQLDGGRSLKEVNEAINKKHFSLNYKTMAWHYQYHIVRGNLINSYSVRWLGTKYNQTLDKPEHRRHRYVGTVVAVRQPSSSEMIDLTTKAHRTPFLWSEMAGKDYLAQFAFPIEDMVNSLEYLREMLHPFGQRATHYIADQKNSVQFALSHQLWSDEQRAWIFEKESTLARFENLVLKVKYEAGSST
jgi:hypothetical protein